ncbi:hypothetical protein F5887DRAFT_925332 [Amanita rubescens]|nr:hypothetical protein F5887DRAFT_925332 [Amanita rubescens]
MYHVLQPSNILRRFGSGVKLTVGTEASTIRGRPNERKAWGVFTRVETLIRLHPSLLLNRQVTVLHTAKATGIGKTKYLWLSSAPQATTTSNYATSNPSPVARKEKKSKEQKGKTLIDDRKGQLKARALHRLPPPSPCLFLAALVRGTPLQHAKGNVMKTQATGPGFLLPKPVGMRFRNLYTRSTCPPTAACCEPSNENGTLYLYACMLRIRRNTAKTTMKMAIRDGDQAGVTMDGTEPGGNNGCAIIVNGEGRDGKTGISST